MLNPLCCIPARIGTLVFAVLDLVISAPFAYDGVMALAYHAFSWDRLMDCILSIVLFTLAVLLMIGVVMKSGESIRIWLGVWAIFVIAWVVLYLIQIFTSSTTLVWVTGVGIGVGLIFGFQFWVVYAYLDEIRKGGRDGMTEKSKLLPYTEI